MIGNIFSNLVFTLHFFALMLIFLKLYMLFRLYIEPEDEIRTTRLITFFYLFFEIFMIILSFFKGIFTLLVPSIINVMKTESFSFFVLKNLNFTSFIVILIDILLMILFIFTQNRAKKLYKYLLMAWLLINTIIGLFFLF